MNSLPADTRPPFFFTDDPTCKWGIELELYSGTPTQNTNDGFKFAGNTINPAR